MRAFFFAVLLAVPFSFAAPILTDRSILGNAAQAVTNPKLTVARVKILKDLATSTQALKAVSSQADATGNADVSSLAATAQQALGSAKGGVAKIGTALVTGATPSKDDQKTVAVGIQDAQTAVNGMAAAITTPDDTLSSNIDAASTKLQALAAAGQDDLDAGGLSLADLGLPDDALSGDATAAAAADTAAATAAADTAAAAADTEAATAAADTAAADPAAATAAANTAATGKQRQKQQKQQREVV